MAINSCEEIISILKSYIEKESFIHLCILYGSAAKNNLTDRSDIDLAIGAEQGLSYEQCLSMSLEMTHMIGREVSVIDIDKMEGIILQEVLSKGITLKNAKPNYKAALISKMYDFSVDILPLQMMTMSKKIKEFLHE